MKTITAYRGRTITDADIGFIRQLIADHPTFHRQALSRKLCELWNWRQANGYLRDMVCRGLLLALHRAGHIELPPARHASHNTPQTRARVPRRVETDQTPLETQLSQLAPLRFELVRKTAAEPLFNSLLQEHHYLGYTQPVGEHLKYLVYSGERIVAAFAWSSAAHGLNCRDQFIGWSRETRCQRRHLLAYNSRFLIPPWIRVPHLASHVLGRLARRLSADWERMYRHPIYFLETFVEPTRHPGSCYKAANWIVLGQTSGRGHRCPTYEPNRPVKLVLGYPLVQRFRELLTGSEPRPTEEPSHGGSTERQSAGL